jgi:hypothetical protein
MLSINVIVVGLLYITESMALIEQHGDFRFYEKPASTFKLYKQIEQERKTRAVMVPYLDISISFDGSNPIW